MLFNAIEKAGSTDADKIANALKGATYRRSLWAGSHISQR